jgi:NAD(P)-dependent dehydrogenase (short-subunit alcohol dehydrogenase family)
MSVVVITGSTKGVGFGLAKAFAARGLDVVVSGRRAEDAQKSADAVRASAPGRRAVGVACEVTNPESVQALWDAAVEEFGGVDIWINNAGLAKTTKHIVDIPVDDVRAMVSTNMLGTIFGSQVAMRGFMARGGGKLFNVLGGGSDGRVRDNMGVYGSTKRGLKFFTDALAREAKDTSVIVGEIRPGILLSDGWLREAAEADPQQIESGRKALNILADSVDDVAPYLADGVLAASKNGAEVAWLTTGKIIGRFATSSWKKRDVLSSYDV